jgi:hypothetical protein
MEVVRSHPNPDGIRHEFRYENLEGRPVLLCNIDFGDLVTVTYPDDTEVQIDRAHLVMPEDN